MDDLSRIRQRWGKVEDLAALLDGVLSHAPIALQIVGADGRCFFVNRAFVDLFGVEPAAESNVFGDETAIAEPLRALLHRAFGGETVREGPSWHDLEERVRRPG